MCLLVEQLQKKTYTTEHTFQDRMSQYFEKIRTNDQQQIQQLWANLDENHQISQTNQCLITQHDEFIRQLQARLKLTEGTSTEILAFQIQALEINEKLEASR